MAWFTGAAAPMVLPYGVPWIPSIYPSHVSTFLTSTVTGSVMGNGKSHLEMDDKMGYPKELDTIRWTCDMHLVLIQIWEATVGFSRLAYRAVKVHSSEDFFQPR